MTSSSNVIALKDGDRYRPALSAPDKPDAVSLDIAGVDRNLRFATEAAAISYGRSAMTACRHSEESDRRFVRAMIVVFCLVMLFGLAVVWNEMPLFRPLFVVWTVCSVAGFGWSSFALYRTFKGPEAQ